jgi:hypothetical protein
MFSYLVNKMFSFDVKKLVISEIKVEKGEKKPAYAGSFDCKLVNY